MLTKQYQLSKGNPIEDAKQLLARLKAFVHDQGATLEVIGFGATGYAADVLEESLRADVNIVETVAHQMAAVKFFGDVDVICDIGGQDIKVLFMANGDIRNFRLSNQCSAGNGMLLQAMADQFGVPVRRVRGRRLQGRPDAEVQLRVRGVPRRRSRQLPERGIPQRGAAGGPRDGPAEERLAVRRADSAHGARSAAATCSRAARSTTSRPSRRRSITSRSACPTPRSTCIRTRAKRARSARRSRRCASCRAAGTRRSSGSMPRSISRTSAGTTRARAATSVRTTAPARSSTPARPTAAHAATSRDSAARRAPSSRSRR